ncbi:MULTISPECIES: HAD family hydrolase [Acinetobacter]|uniref:HAD family hydrolase n=1 Tax=Acinetobacter TaxID=469 RepID=UPI0002CF2BC6|nr:MULTISPECIES: HAD hydrolase-like protein [Acinetobacter]ENX56508.1 hypothetical protein F885_03891 [Acinetobacter higginsii]
MIKEYNMTIVFDCDGVLLNSNIIKTKAFYQSALPYGKTAAQAFVNYHIKNGGISRYKKFEYFMDKIVPKLTENPIDLDVEQLLSEYAKQVRKELLQCEIAENLHTLRQQTQHANWLVVSGSDQQELREIFAMRGLTELFDGGIFGSPDTKDEILTREAQNGNIKQSALLVGDSRYDYEAATKAGLDFIFVYGWTEMQNWKNWVDIKAIQSVKNIKELQKYLT